ncbi:uncharacterized protein C7orf26 homolog [Hyalella azteca]|uniref:Uncharacterized protein C7orf26 homolog n=1 Tax=Hyalella azteca TaxID=294128 RepID=A0A8B7PAF0_HYAAZ|nr:uncharacterized protein C7orf26 homolog [Hyalella azteca]
MAGVDLHDLQMQEFPHNVRLGLRKLEQSLQGSPAPQIAILQQHIIDDFILSTQNADKKKGKSSKIQCQPINDLIVVRILCEHLTTCTDPAVHNAIVMLLFHPSLIDVSPPQASNVFPITKATNPYSRTPHGPINSYSNATGPNNGNPYFNAGNAHSFNTRQYTPVNPYGSAHEKIIPGQPIKGSSNPYARSANSPESKIANRLNTLSSLMSLAVATKNAKVLDRLAVWMQEVCCLSGWCCQVSKRLMAEYCSVPQLNSSSKEGASESHPLDDLPTTSPFFTSCIITSWAEIYARLGSSPLTSCRRPPVSVLRLMVRWLTSAPPELLLTPLTISPSTTSTGGLLGPSSPPSTVTALAPLLRLCVEAPFFLRSSSPPRSSLLIKSSSTARDVDDVFNKRTAEAGSSAEEQELYSRLQLCLLRCLQCLPAVLTPPHANHVLSYQQVTVIMEGLLLLLDPEKMDVDCAPVNCEVRLQTKVEAVNRLAQVILVAKRSGALYGSPVELNNALRRLPIYNRLVKILLTSELS